MTEEELKKGMGAVYKQGIKNGAILIKNKILKTINRDKKIFFSFKDGKDFINLLKTIEKIQLSGKDK